MASTRGMSPQSALEVVMVPRTKLANLEEVARETDGWEANKSLAKRRVFPTLIEIKEDTESQEGEIIALD